MSGWLPVVRTIHAAFLVVAAVGFFRFWTRTRFWLPRYVHYMALGAAAVGILLVAVLPPGSPADKAGYGLWIRTLIIIGFPAIVYVAFVLYGGQHAAYQSRTDHDVPCPYCGKTNAAHGTTCASCGQTLIGHTAGSERRQT